MQDNYSLKTTNATIAANYIIVHTNKYTLTKNIDICQPKKFQLEHLLRIHFFRSRLFHGLPNSLMVGQYQPLHFGHDCFQVEYGAYLCFLVFFCLILMLIEADYYNFYF